MNVACDDVLLQPNEDSSSYLKNEKYYSFNNIRRKSLKNSEQEEKCLNRIKSLSTSSYSIKPETLKSLSLDKITEDSDYKNDMSEDNKANKSNEQISIFQMDRDDENQSKTVVEPVMANLNPKLCMTPETVLRTKYDILTSYERVEIRDYEEIWYIGSSSVQKIDIAYKKPSEKKHGEKEVINNGYDDSRGDYHIVLHDHINYRYEIISLLGKGSFGKVLKCYDHKEKNYVAVKIIKNKKRFEKQGMVEVKVLDAIKSRDPENVMNSYNIKFIESFYFRGHLCIVNELLGINLYEWIKNGGFRGITISMIRHITKEVLTSLEVLENKKIVHCDLKPENILLRDPMQIKPSLSSADLDKIGIKVIDFGSSCYEHERIYTYVQSRFYRSPEVILGIPYNMSIDMWSLGCILAELYTGYPIFPGENEEEQLACIMEIMGAPAHYIVEQGSRKKNFFDANNNPKIIANSKGKKRRPGSLSLASVLRCRDNTFIDFITQCLQWDPEKRLTASQGLKHEFITKLNKKSSYDSRTIANNNTTYNSFEEFKKMNNSASIKKTKSTSNTLTIPKSISKPYQSPSQNINSEKSVTPLKNNDIKHSTSQFNPINITRSSVIKTNTVTGISVSNNISTDSNNDSNLDSKSGDNNLPIDSKSGDSNLPTSSNSITSNISKSSSTVSLSSARKNSITNLPTGRKNSISSLPKVSNGSANHNIQLRKSTGNLLTSTASSGKVAKIIAAAEQKTLSSSNSYSKKDISIAIETIKNVRRPSVKEIALAKDNIERANALMKSKRNPPKPTITTKKPSFVLDSNYKFTTKVPRLSIPSGENQLETVENTLPRSAYPKLSSTIFSTKESSTDSFGSSTAKESSTDSFSSLDSTEVNGENLATIERSRPIKYSLLSKSLNPGKDSVLQTNKGTTSPDQITHKNSVNDEIDKLDFSKVDIKEDTMNKTQISSLKQPNVYSVKRSSSSGNMLLSNIQNIRKSYSESNTNNTNSVNTNNSKYSSSIPKSTVKLLPINNTNTNNNTIIGNNSSFSSTISSSSSSTLVNDDICDTPPPLLNSNTTLVNSLSLLTKPELPVVKTRPRAHSHSTFQSIQGSSIPRLASIYKNSSNNITKTINKINSNIESHNSPVTKDKDITSAIKTAGLVTKRKSAFSLKVKASQISHSHSQSHSATTPTTLPRWKI